MGKMSVFSTLPEIQRCIREIYSCAGTSTGSRRELSQVNEWFLVCVRILRWGFGKGVEGSLRSS